MVSQTEVVITGVGVVSPIGIGRDAFCKSLQHGNSGVGPIRAFDAAALPVRIAAEIHDFDATEHVANRKSLKVMCRDAQLGVVASVLARRDARLDVGAVDPERLGVVLGADRICAPLDESVETYRACMVDGRLNFDRWGTGGMAASFPLGFLRVLPNMVTSHVSIEMDARGPNNTIHHAELSSLAAISEAARVIERGWADVMIAGGASSQMDPFDYTRRCVMGILSPRNRDPAAVMRPFDADRNGQVFGEGAATFVIESRRHARGRGANVLATLLGWSTTCEPRRRGTRLQGTGICRAVELALERAGLGKDGLGHVNAHGLSTVEDDQMEARALSATVPNVPVTAPKSYFGNLGAAGGAVEMAVSVLGGEAGAVPATLNYERKDPDCPIRIIDGKSVFSSAAPALVVNWTPSGQAMAVVLGGAG